MSPWRIDVLEFSRRLLRMSLWICIMVIGLMGCVFLVAFAFEFLTHLWSWCRRALFDGSW